MLNINIFQVPGASFLAVSHYNNLRPYTLITYFHHHQASLCVCPPLVSWAGSEVSSGRAGVITELSQLTHSFYAFLKFSREFALLPTSYLTLVNSGLFTIPSQAAKCGSRPAKRTKFRPLQKYSSEI